MKTNKTMTGGFELLPPILQFGEQQRSGPAVESDAAAADMRRHHAGHHRQHRRNQKVADDDENCPVHLPPSPISLPQRSFCRSGQSIASRRIRLKIMPIKVEL